MNKEDKEESDFEKVTSDRDKENYWKAVLESKTALLAQLSNGNTVLLTPLEIKIAQLFVNSATNSLPDKDANLLISFNALKDRLFIRTQLSRTPDGQYFIDIFSDLYRLQRRENFRIVLPENASLDVFINQLGENNVKIKARVVDISLGGVLVELPNMDGVILNNDWIAGIISTDKETGIQFKGNIKHIRDLPKLQKRRVGVCFDKLVGNGLNELNKLVMKYYHKMFSKFSNF